MWTAVGPSADNYAINGVLLNKVDFGRLTAIVPNPSSRNQMYMVAAGGGLWRADNLLSKPPTAKKQKNIYPSAVRRRRPAPPSRIVPASPKSRVARRPSG